jgi:hypothetical protein
VLHGTVCVSTRFDLASQACCEPAQEAKPEEPAPPEDGEEEPYECPLCTYMANTPCKDVFNVFKVRVHLGRGGLLPSLISDSRTPPLCRLASLDGRTFSFEGTLGL